jgi:hypothetical protein
MRPAGQLVVTGERDEAGAGVGTTKGLPLRQFNHYTTVLGVAYKTNTVAFRE